jgi:DNA-binding response OmpR family regulator
MRILIVEDDRRVARFVEKGLNENAYSTSWATGCSEANDLMSEGSYDMVVLDLGLPDGDGLDLLRDWRRCGFNEPVLILSARDSLEDRINGLNRMDLLGHTVTYEGRGIDLTNREFALLEALLQNKGRVLTRTQIGEKIWDAHYDMQTNLIDVYIRKLRQNLGDQSEPPLIKTVRGVGYSMP